MRAFVVVFTDPSTNAPQVKFFPDRKKAEDYNAVDSFLKGLHDAGTEVSVVFRGKAYRNWTFKTETPKKETVKL